MAEKDNERGSSPTSVTQHVDGTTTEIYFHGVSRTYINDKKFIDYVPTEDKDKGTEFVWELVNSEWVEVEKKEGISPYIHKMNISRYKLEKLPKKTTTNRYHNLQKSLLPEEYHKVYKQIRDNKWLGQIESVEVFKQLQSLRKGAAGVTIRISGLLKKKEKATGDKLKEIETEIQKEKEVLIEKYKELSEIVAKVKSFGIESRPDKSDLMAAIKGAKKLKSVKAVKKTTQHSSLMDAIRDSKKLKPVKAMLKSSTRSKEANKEVAGKNTVLGNMTENPTIQAMLNAANDSSSSEYDSDDDWSDDETENVVKKPPKEDAKTIFNQKIQDFKGRNKRLFTNKYYQFLAEEIISWADHQKQGGESSVYDEKYEEFETKVSKIKEAVRDITYLSHTKRQEVFKEALSDNERSDFDEIKNGHELTDDSIDKLKVMRGKVDGATKQEVKKSILSKRDLARKFKNTASPLEEIQEELDSMRKSSKEGLFEGPATAIGWNHIKAEVKKIIGKVGEGDEKNRLMKSLKKSLGNYEAFIAKDEVETIIEELFNKKSDVENISSKSGALRRKNVEKTLKAFFSNKKFVDNTKKRRDVKGLGQEELKKKVNDMNDRFKSVVDKRKQQEKINTTSPVGGKQEPEQHLNTSKVVERSLSSDKEGQTEDIINQQVVIKSEVDRKQSATSAKVVIQEGSPSKDEPTKPVTSQPATSNHLIQDMLNNSKMRAAEIKKSKGIQVVKQYFEKVYNRYLELADGKIKNIPKEQLLDILMLPKEASSADIKYRYRQLSLIFHPDKKSIPKEEAEVIIKKINAVNDEIVKKNEEKTDLKWNAETFEKAFNEMSEQKILGDIFDLMLHIGDSSEIDFVDQRFLKIACNRGMEKVALKLLDQPKVLKHAHADNNLALRTACKKGMSGVALKLLEQEEVMKQAYVSDSRWFSRNYNVALRDAFNKGMPEVAMKLLEQPAVLSNLIDYKDDKDLSLNKVVDFCTKHKCQYALNVIAKGANSIVREKLEKSINNKDKDTTMMLLELKNIYYPKHINPIKAFFMKVMSLPIDAIVYIWRGLKSLFVSPSVSSGTNQSNAQYGRYNWVLIEACEKDKLNVVLKLLDWPEVMEQADEHTHKSLRKACETGNKAEVLKLLGQVGDIGPSESPSVKSVGLGVTQPEKPKASIPQGGLSFFKSPQTDKNHAEVNSSKKANPSKKPSQNE